MFFAVALLLKFILQLRFPRNVSILTEASRLYVMYDLLSKFNGVLVDDRLDILHKAIAYFFLTFVEFFVKLVMVFQASMHQG